MLRTRLIAGRVTGLVLSAAFAVFATIVVLGPSLVEPLRVRPGHPAPVALRNGLGDAAELRVPSGLVASPGDVLERDTARARIATRIERARRPPSVSRALAFLIIFFVLAQMITTYVPRLSPSRGALLRTQVGLLAMLGSLIAVSQLVLLLTPVSALVLPVALVPLWASHFIDRRTALIVGFAASFLLASLVGFRLVALVTFLSTTLTATGLLRDRKHPYVMAITGLAAGVVALFAAGLAKDLFDGGVDLAQEISRPFASELLAALLGGPIAGAVAVLAQPVPVLALGAVSRTRLLELTDLDQPLLRKMAAEAPGSWEHARAMANLAEAAAAAIGADALLTRVGAY
jgi:cyclic-di-AMP phosphodiesterase PgpH